MSEALIKHFILEDFNPEKFVKDLSSQCIGAEELRQQRAKIQELANSTSVLLKRNVYQNYIQFIETAKEISHLESEMYQLSQLLSDQRSLLSILGTSRSADVPFQENIDIETENVLNLKSKEDESKQKLILLLENVEGAMSLVETPKRICLHEGSLLELDPVEGTPIKRIHAYLFNDVLMIASWLANGNKRGPPRFKMQVVYDLQSLAVVNIRDLGTVKLAFKLLAFSDTRIFQCATANSKKEWLDKCEQAKNLKISQENHLDPISGKKYTKLKQLLPICQSSSTESNVIGNEQHEDIEFKEALPEWMLEIAEDLDSCIAQRHFEEAYSLIKKGKTYITSVQMSSELGEIKSKLNDRAKHLVYVLTKELESSAEAKSLQGSGLRSSKRAVKLLLQLDCIAQAYHLYLKLCSIALKARLKRVKREGATVPYVKQLSAIAFSNIVEMSREFLKIFPQSTNCCSALVVWCSHEFMLLTSHLIKQMFLPQVPLSTLVECILIIRDHCEQLTNIGMDFRCQLDSQLRAPLIRALQDTGEKYVDAVKVRALEDIWKPSNFQTGENLYRVLSELDDLGISLPEFYMKNDYCIPLTNNSLTFSKLFMGLLEDCLNVFTPEILNVIDRVLISVLEVQVRHVQSALKNPKYKQEKKLVQDNAKYIHDVIICRSLELYESVTGNQFKRLLSLQEHLHFQPVATLSKPKPAPRTSITKYSTTGYI